MLSDNTTLIKVWNSIKKYNVALIWGVVVFLHTYAYLPYIQTKIENDMTDNISTRVVDSLKAQLLEEVNHQQIGFVLRLSDELNTNINHLPRKIANSVLITDSAVKYYPLINIVKRQETIISCGLKIDNDKKYYLSSDKTIYPCFYNDFGIYYVNRKGVKKYVE